MIKGANKVINDYLAEIVLNRATMSLASRMRIRATFIIRIAIFTMEKTPRGVTRGPHAFGGTYIQEGKYSYAIRLYDQEVGRSNC